MIQVKRFFWLWLVALTALPVEVSAIDYFKPEYNYLFSVTYKERGCVHFKVLILDQHSNWAASDWVRKGKDSGEWTRGGTVYARKKGENDQIPLFSFYSSEDWQVSDKHLSIGAYRRTAETGYFVITNLKDKTDVSTDEHGVPFGGKLITDSDGQWYQIPKLANQENQVQLELDWYYPISYAGNCYDFLVQAKTSANATDVNRREMTGTGITFDAQPNINITTPIFLPTGVHAGYYMMMIPNTTGVKTVVQQAVAYDAKGEHPTDITTECKSTEDGVGILIPSADSLRYVDLTCQVPYSRHVYMSSVSNRQTLQAFHAPKNIGLNRAWGSKASNILRWTVPNAQYPDAVKGDMYKVERQLYTDGDTVNVGLWEPIATTPLEVNKTDYEVTDSTKGSYGDKTYNSVRYRISRSIIGTENGNYKTVEVPQASAQVKWDATVTPLPIEVKDGKVHLSWNVNDHSNGNNTFLPEGYNIKLVREESYTKNGKPETGYTVTDITQKVNKGAILPADTSNIIMVRTAEDWNRLARSVDSSLVFREVMLMADLTVRTPIGQKNPFYGTFDGNGHTLTANISGDGLTGIFRNAQKYTIKNLHVAGVISSSYNVGGLVGSSEDGNISNCRVSATLEANSRYGGGLIGMCQGNENTVTNCLFDGKIVGMNSGASYTFGPVYGTTSGSYTIHVNNCLDRGTYENMTTFTLMSQNRWSNCWTYNGYATWNKANDLAQQEVADKLDATQWTLENGHAVPRSIDGKNYRLEYSDDLFSPCTQYKYSVTYLFNDAAELMAQKEMTYKDAVEPVHDVYEINDFSASNDVYQDKVRLKWNLDLSHFSDVNLYRKEGGKTTALPIDKQLKYYDDFDVTAGKAYEYLFEATYECTNGINKLSATATGMRRASGKIGGFVTFADGIGIANVDVVLYRVSESGESTETARVKSTASGTYLFPDVPFLDYPEYYKVMVESTQVNFDTSQLNITLNGEQAFHYNKNFISNSAFDFEGYVYFERTTVPVYGATFTIGGEAVVDKTGKPVTTDNDGHFNFKVLKGAKDICVHKEGHTFMFGGYFADNSGVHLEMTENMKSVFFWDQTKVRTIGRVTGGLDQGEKALGFGLSRNNLGDNLRIVLELDGNLRSWLVKDQLNDTLRTVTQEYQHEAAEGNLTNRMVTNRRQVVIYPNALTGEYIADLLPTRYKVVEVSAKGYSSLFQSGVVSEVLDLSDSLQQHHIEYNSKAVDCQAIYNRIYRCQPTVSITQQTDGGDNLPFIGLASYTEQTASGTPVTVPVYDEKTRKYTFGYPLLQTGNYTFYIQATENYYYNGVTTNTCDSVPLRGGQVKIYDDFIAEKRDTTCTLSDHTGGIAIPVTVSNTVYDVSGTNALRHLDVSLEYNGQYIDGGSVRAFVIGTEQLTGDIICSDGMLNLEGVLRDPPGSNSYAWIEKGTTFTSDFNYTFKASVDVSIGMDIGSGTSLTMATWSGVPPGGVVMGKQNRTQSYVSVDPQKINIANAGITQKGRTYFELNERIQTGRTTDAVGADGDLYYGYEMVSATNVVRGMRVVNSTTYEYLKGMGLFDDANGCCQMIQEGTGTDGMKYYLISDIDYLIGPKVKSHFIYSQSHILNEVIPQLEKVRNTHFYKGSREQAQARANELMEPVYLSLVPEDDPRYGQDNLDDSLEYITIDRYDECREKLNYEMIMPGFVDELDLRRAMAHRSQLSDTIRIYNQRIDQWKYMVAMNEYDKIMAIQTIDQQTGRDKMSFDAGTPYDVKTQGYYMESHTISGGVPFSHSEQFDAGSSVNRFGNLFGSLDVSKLSSGNNWEKWATKGMTALCDVATSATNSGLNYLNNAIGIQDKIGNALAKKYPQSNEAFIRYSTRAQNGDVTDHTISKSDLRGFDNLKSIARSLGAKNVTHVEVGGTYLDVTIQPSVSITFDNTSNTDLSKKVTKGYVLENNSDSHQTIEIYHDVKSNIPTRVNLSGADTDFKTFSAGNYIFRTLGGATKCPFEPASTTKLWKEGTVISNATAQVERPRISVENHIISGVPYGEKAKFNLVLSNEGLVAGEETFDLVLLDASNQKGASLTMDGAPLGNGRSLTVPYGTGLVKVLEVGAGLVDDYEDIRLLLRSQCDMTVADTVSLSVHFTPTASPVSVITPPDKWVLNTNSAQDSQGRYYLPVSIKDFDVNFRNFDHVELQYKQSTEPETRWTNLCSYYSDDSLYQQGTGTKAMLESNTITHTFYGDSDPVEMRYDLRAVTYSRLGNGYVTNSSPILSGIKDTRRPQLFGNPQPANGILTISDDLKLVFSEPINANRLLNANNFKVSGLPNSSDINTSTSLYFPTDTCGIGPEAEHNFAYESFTVDLMIKPAEDYKEPMVFFEHENLDLSQLFMIGLNDRKELTAHFYNNLMKKVSLFKSKPLTSVNWNMFQRILVTYDSKTREVHFYCNGTNVDASENNILTEGYGGNGTMSFGTWYKGNMLEARIWNKALTPAEMAESSKSLNGYEPGLVNYYPMNEGFGSEVKDKAQGATINLKNGVSWKLPVGCALRVDGSRAITFKEKLFEKTSEAKSYSLSLWFRSSQKDDYAIMASGIGDSTEVGADGKLFIGVKNHQLTVSSHSYSIKTGNNVSDDQWHHLAFVVDRVANIASLYVDGELAEQCSAAHFGNPYGAYRLGSCRYQQSDSTSTDMLFMKGYIDQITLWNMALPHNIVKQRMTEGCDGSEIGLLAYIPFQEHVQQVSGGGTKIAFTDHYLYNQYDTDAKKNVIFKESAFSDVQESDLLVSEDIFAPVREKGKTRFLSYNFITKDNELLINLNEAPKDIERTTVNLTVMGVEDKNGNEMEQPITWSAFINCNMVRWESQKEVITINALEKVNTTFKMTITNKGGAKHTYTIEGLPSWMSVDEGTMGELDPTESTTLTLNISKDINIGKYNHTLYLVNDEGLSDPLMLTIIKKGPEPDWSYDKNAQKNMQITAQVKMAQKVLTDKNSIVAAFDSDDVCMGSGQIEIDARGKAILYLTVYGQESKKENLKFRMWNSSTGLIFSLDPDQPIVYTPDAMYGSYEQPVIFTATQQSQQHIELTPVWTWVSLNVKSEQAGNVERLLSKGTWTQGDQLKDPELHSFYNYEKGHWTYSKGSQHDSLTCDRMYYIKSQSQQTLLIEGTPIYDKKQRTIYVRNGWNYIGYTPTVNLTIQEALADYYGKVSDGDIIKSQNEFATFSKVYGWTGNLKYMKPGCGYMLKHTVTPERPDTLVKFVYPYKAIENAFVTESREMADEPLLTNSHRTSMTMTARAAGIETAAGDRLMAYADGELCGMAEAVEIDGRPVFFLSIGGDESRALSYTIERGGRLLGSTAANDRFRADDHEGTTDVPKVINFNDPSHYQQGVWYSVSGVSLGNRRPTAAGVYVFNGEKVVVSR